MNSRWCLCSAEAAMVLSIHSTERTDPATTSSEALSLCQRVIKRQSIRVAVVAELLVDLPFFFHVRPCTSLAGWTFGRVSNCPLYSLCTRWRS